MKKVLLAGILLLLCLLCACNGTRAAVMVDDATVDEAEYAFYLHLNGLSLDDPEMARDKAIEQITAGEVVRAQCAARGLSLSETQKAELREEKAAFISSLGGQENYRLYLKSICLTDRGFDKLSENDLYYELLRGSFEKSFSEDGLLTFFRENYVCLYAIGFGDNLSRAEKFLRLASGENADFDALAEEYGGGEKMVVSRLAAANDEYLREAFSLAVNGVGGVYEGGFVVRRLPLDESFFREYRDDVAKTAEDAAFSEQLALWCSQAETQLLDSARKIGFDNAEQYVR